MRRTLRPVGLALIVCALLTALAAAQPRSDARGPVFRVEPETRTDYARPGSVTGWLYNDGQGVAGLVRMRVEILDGSGKVLSEHLGWAYGNVTPGGRAYFMIPIPAQSPPNRRVTVESYVLQSVTTESP
jgi:hypothetical protein